MTGKKINGRLILNEIPVNELWIRKVSKNNISSGKVTLPKKLINKEVYIILKGD